MADPLAIHAARDHVRKCLATELRPQFEAVLKRTEDLGEYSVDATAQGKRALHNAALAFLSCLKTPELYAYCLEKVMKPLFWKGRDKDEKGQVVVSTLETMVIHRKGFGFWVYR